MDMNAWVRPMKLDLRERVPDLNFPLRVPYSTLGFMGPLSGSAGDLIIHQDGQIEFNTHDRLLRCWRFPRSWLLTTRCSGGAQAPSAATRFRSTPKTGAWRVPLVVVDLT